MPDTTRRRSAPAHLPSAPVGMLVLVSLVAHAAPAGASSGDPSTTTTSVGRAVQDLVPPDVVPQAIVAVGLLALVVTTLLAIRRSKGPLDR